MGHLFHPISTTLTSNEPSKSINSFSLTKASVHRIKYYKSQFAMGHSQKKRVAFNKWKKKWIFLMIKVTIDKEDRHHKTSHA